MFCVSINVTEDHIYSLLQRLKTEAKTEIKTE